MLRISVDGFTGDSLQKHFRTAAEISKTIKESPEEYVVIDVSNSKWFNPASLVPLCVTYHREVRNGRQIEFELPNDLRTERYLNTITFPEGSTDPSKHYKNHLPLCQLSTDPSSGAAEHVGSKLQSLLRKEFESLSGEAVQGISYPISEMVDNIDQHSNCDVGAVLVQRYPSKEFIDIGIVDDGVSVPGNFESHGVEFDSDKEALSRAAKGLVSTKPDTGHNRGFGISTTINLVCNGMNGSVLFQSRDGSYFKDGERVYCSSASNTWPGTSFIFRLHVPEDGFGFLDYITD